MDCEAEKSKRAINDSEITGNSFLQNVFAITQTLPD